jgi:glycosyltransferase involved in cell wall biosynthesis
MKKRVCLRGPFLSQSGYGEQARYLYDALRSFNDVDLFIENTNWGATSWITDKEIEGYIKKTAHYVESRGSYDLFIQVSIPNEIEKKAPLNILYTAGIETTKIAPEWIEKVNTIDKVIVVSEHAKWGFDNTKYKMVAQEDNRDLGHLHCHVPVEVQNYPWPEKTKAKKLKLNLKHKFNFLSVGQWSIRKNLAPMVVWFMEEFKDDEVGLILKTSVRKQCILDRNHTEKKLRSLIKHHKENGAKCNVHLLHGNLTREEMYGLYKHPDVKALLAMSHGEGAGLPIFEAAQVGLPVIAPAWSGYLDFMTDDGETYFTEVDYDMARVQPEAVWEGVIMEESMWCYPKPDSVKKAMRGLYSDPEEALEKAAKLKKILPKKFDRKKMYQEFYDKTVGLLEVNNDEIEEWLKDIEIFD